MRVLIYSYEHDYEGMHGIYDYWVGEVKDIEEANDIGRTMAEDLVDSYDLYSYVDSENNEDFWEIISDRLDWEIFPIKDSVILSDNELEEIVYNKIGIDEFVKIYCEERI